MDGEAIAALVEQFLADPLQLVAAVEDLKRRLPEANDRKPSFGFHELVAETQQLVAALRLIEKARGDVFPWHCLPDLTVRLNFIGDGSIWPGELNNSTAAYQAFENALETFHAAVLVQIPSGDHTLVPLRQLARHAGCDRKTISGWLRNIRHAEIRSNAKWFRYSDVRDRLVEVCRHHKNAHQRSIVWPENAADLRTG